MGTGNGVALIVVLWMVVDFLLAVIYGGRPADIATRLTSKR